MKRAKRREFRKLLEATANKQAFFQLVSEHQREVERRVRACKATAK